MENITINKLELASELAYQKQLNQKQNGSTTKIAVKGR
jgi:hypothetical protein